MNIWRETVLPFECEAGLQPEKQTEERPIMQRMALHAFALKFKDMRRAGADGRGAVSEGFAGVGEAIGYEFLGGVGDLPSC